MLYGTAYESSDIVNISVKEKYYDVSFTQYRNTNEKFLGMGTEQRYYSKKSFWKYYSQPGLFLRKHLLLKCL